MDILCSFYIGHQDYLGESPNLAEEESGQSLVAEVDAVLQRNLGKDGADVQPALDQKELSAELEFSENTIPARGFSIETAVADDQDGLPVLLYINAYFSVPVELEDEVAELEENGKLDDEILVTLRVSNRIFPFEGVAEVVFD